MFDVRITTTSLTLLDQMQGGQDQRAWHTFMRAYAPLLIAFAKRLGLSDADANDAVQDTLVAVHRHFQNLDAPFDRSKGRFKSWLRGVAQHKVRDIQRRRARIERAEAARGQETPGTARGTDGLEEAFEEEWQRNLLARALEQVAREVPPNVFQAFELYAVHGRSPDDVARLLGISRNAVYIRKTRALRCLTRVYQALLNEEC